MTAELLAQCAATPADDGPRLVWADAQDDARGELVVVQCDLARGGLAPGQSAARRQRQRALLAAHGAAWSGLAAFATQCTFRRGFVEHASIDIDTFCEHAGAIADAAPLLASLRTFTRDEGRGAEPLDLARGTARLVATYGQLFAHPAYRRLRGVELGSTGLTSWRDGQWVFTGFENRVAEVVALAIELGAFAHLDALACMGLTPEAARRLADTRALAGIERLALPYCACDAETLATLVASMPRLRALNLRFARDVVDVLPALPAGLVELELRQPREDLLAALAGAPCAATLERLAVDGESHDARDIGALARLPRLRSLDLGVAFDPDAELAFAGLGLRRLRELIAPMRTAAGAAALVDAFGEQLEHLRLPQLDATQLDALAPRVAGELDRSERAPAIPLFADAQPAAPWWDHPAVSLR